MSAAAPRAQALETGRPATLKARDLQRQHGLAGARLAADEQWALEGEGHVDGLLCIPLENVRRVSALIWRNPPLDPTT